MRQRLIIFLFLLMFVSAFAQNVSMVSPNNKWQVALKNEASGSTGHGI